MQLLRNAEGVLKMWQAGYAQAGIRDTNGTVPHIPVDPVEQVWVLDHGGVPIGLLSLLPTGDERIIEVGARFWDQNPRIGYILADWIDGVLRRYDVVVARCYRDNWPVKKLLQRGGFRLIRIEGKIEFYTVTKDTYLGRRKEIGHHG